MALIARNSMLPSLSSLQAHCGSTYLFTELSIYIATTEEKLSLSVSWHMNSATAISCFKPNILTCTAVDAKKNYMWVDPTRL